MLEQGQVYRLGEVEVVLVYMLVEVVLVCMNEGRVYMLVEVVLVYMLVEVVLVCRLVEEGLVCMLEEQELVCKLEQELVCRLVCMLMQLVCTLDIGLPQHMRHQRHSRCMHLRCM